MTDNQRAAFEAEMRKDLGMPEYVELNWEADYVATAWKYYQAALASPEAQALRKDAERYRFIRPGDATVWCSSGDYPMENENLDAAIDAAMEEQK
ncbi:hypothetical protein [Neopusillimonas aromaticivorans]|uniref:hypothetical protein n=1 Tax=Neopusillimonas aromaticivorans TaxID=2979868 RepID=UPI002593B1BA|nr:hypothetical protein [Neopusillimonas aromaticivorans]WJJ94041.1 hypothetical protein N7E01_02350 [Neopusillimonas aromaticivorans]